MPNKKAAIKELRKTIKRTRHNSLIKRNIEEVVKKGKKAIEDGTINEKAPALIKQLQKAVDKAVKTNILKVNTGNRYKSRFSKLIAKAKKTPKT
jgi:ribosomal protein S20